MAEPHVCAPIDANGNLTTDGTRTFEWDARNQPVAVGIAPDEIVFAYDGHNRRTQSTTIINGTIQDSQKLLWCGQSLCEDRLADGTSVARRTFRHGEVIGSTAEIAVHDHLGSVRATTASSGVMSGTYEYDPWGRRIVTGSVATPIGFTGQRFDQNRGIMMTLFRQYDPELGRWLSDDPAGLRVGSNLTIYVDNNPVNSVDPLGLQAAPPFPPPGVSAPRLPWSRPDGCCDQNAIQKAEQSVLLQMNRMRKGEPPSGTSIGGSQLTENDCDPQTGWCTPWGPGPDSKFDPNTSEPDPCVRYCIAQHEWIHFNDRRRWRLTWSDADLARFKEWPAYEAELQCLRSFR
jgi:RHS repeat-associated protein